MTKPQTHDAEHSHGRRATGLLILVLVLLALSIAAVLLGALARSRSDRAAQTAVVTCGDVSLSNRDLSYYYWSEYFYFTAAVSESLPGFDATLPPQQQMYDETRSWQDYFLERTLITVRDTVSMSLAAQQAGFTLPESYRSAYERVLTQFDEAAQQQGYADTDAYLRASFGPSATRESFAAYLYDAHMAAAYSDELYEAIEPTEEALEEYISLHSADYADASDEESIYSEAADDLRREEYQNVFLSLTDSYQFLVDYDAITLYEPDGLFEAE